MRPNVARIAIAAVALLSVAFATGSTAADLDALYHVLKPHLSINTQRVNQAAIDAALHAIDPHATLVPIGQDEAPPELSTVASAEVWPEGIAHAKLNGAYKSDRVDAIDNLRTCLTTNTIGLILDLRGAGGRDLDTLDALAGLFFTLDTVIYELHNGHGTVLEQHRASASAPPPAVPPVMLLIDGNTQGASEALAAILRGHPGVMLLGQSTGGDSAQRTRVAFTATHDVRVGTAWLIPMSGAPYHPTGVQPHIPISPASSSIITNALATTATTAASAALPASLSPTSTNEPAQTITGPTLAERVGGDPMLRRATDIILGLHALHQP